MAHEYSPVARMHCTDPHALKCWPGPYIELAGAMSASREPCTVVRFIVWQRRLHVSPPANEPNWLLESKHLATPAIGNLAKTVSRYIAQGNAGLMFKQNRGNVKLQRRFYGSSPMTDCVFQLYSFKFYNYDMTKILSIIWPNHRGVVKSYACNIPVNFIKSVSNTVVLLYPSAVDQWTHWGRDNICDFLQAIFLYFFIAFSHENHCTGHWWIPLTKASDAELWCFLWSAPEQTVE